MTIKKTVKTVVTVAAALMSASIVHAAASLNWGTTGSLRAYQNGGSILITGGASSSVGGFVQLLYLGADATYNGFQDTGTGVQGDDTVVATTFVGFGAMNRSGEFNVLTSHNYAAGSKFLMVFFEVPSASGNVPTTGNYGTSELFTSTADPSLGGIDTFNFDKNYSASTLVAVPEPTTVALMLAGLGMLAVRRFARA